MDRIGVLLEMGSSTGLVATAASPISRSALHPSWGKTHSSRRWRALPRRGNSPRARQRTRPCRTSRFSAKIFNGLGDLPPWAPKRDGHAQLFRTEARIGFAAHEGKFGRLAEGVRWQTATQLASLSPIRRSFSPVTGTSVRSILGAALALRSRRDRGRSLCRCRHDFDPRAPNRGEDPTADQAERDGPGGEQSKTPRAPLDGGCRRRVNSRRHGVMRGLCAGERRRLFRVWPGRNRFFCRVLDEPACELVRRRGRRSFASRVRILGHASCESRLGRAGAASNTPASASSLVQVTFAGGEALADQHHVEQVGDGPSVVLDRGGRDAARCPREHARNERRKAENGRGWSRSSAMNSARADQAAPRRGHAAT